MRFRSTRSENPQVSFKDAVLRCLPPEGGLYVPSATMDLRQFFMHMDDEITYPELTAAIAPALFQGELNPFSASRVAESAFNFEPELRQIDDDFSILNLYNGPTGIFKDFGIAFLAAAMEEFLKNSGSAMILSAVRGDTGISIANAFSGRGKIVPVMIYPSGSIRGLDPSTFVPNGGNVIPIQVRGTFDDCQRLVHETINDRVFAERYNITSANAINPGRLLPQSLYFFYAFIKIKKRLKGDLVFSVPSGNFGNLIAGLYAWKFGMPVNGFIAAMNANNAAGDFFRGKKFVPKPLIRTCSPALDVSIPSNYERLVAFYEEAPAVMHNMVHPVSVSDGATRDTIAGAWKKHRLLLGPHTAVAFAAAQELSSSREWSGHVHTVILATEHPAREAGIIADVTGQFLPIPAELSALRKKSDPIAVIEPELEALEGAVASCF
ncbi:MAG: threonine synthase [Treponema sp.]|jgi:threonine synthase|nr:threonine synthase [Treponema sp.]